MDHILRLHEFFVEGKDREQSHVLLHITEPATEEEKQKGYFFAICEINQGNTAQIVKLQSIIDQIENEYYTPSPDTFEDTLGKVNPAGFDLLNENIQLHCLVGVIKKNEIVFSFFGQPLMVLFYKTKQGTYQKLNLIESNAGDDNHTLFSQVIEGKISPEDFMLVGTPHILDYFNFDRLEKIITTRPARQSAEHLEKVLTDLKNGLPFGGLIINLATPSIAAQKIIAPKVAMPKGGSAQSLNTFFDTEKQTANILSPSMMPKINNKLRNIFNGRNEAAKPTMPPPTPEETTPAEISSSHLRPHHSEKRLKSDRSSEPSYLLVTAQALKIIFIYLGKMLLWFGILLWEIATRIVNFIGALFFVITNIHSRRRLVLDNWRRSWYSYKENIKQISLATKILLLLSLVILLIFVGSILYLRNQQAKKIARQSFDAGLEQIRLKQDAAESALIYNDEAAALGQIQIANQILSGLDCSDSEYKKECDDSRSQLEQIAAKLRKITVAQPQILFDWGNFVDTKQTLNNLIKIGTKIIAFSDTTSTLFLYDILTKENKVITSPLPNNGFNEASAPKENDYALFLFNKKSLARFDPKDNSIKNYDLSFASDNIDIKSLVIYNRRLYTLDTANNIIYRHDPIKNGFGRGNEWLKDKSANLTNGVDITVDGDLFVQKSDGQIIKYNAGNLKPFTVSGVDPTLTSADKIWSYVDLAYLYILDSKGKRLLVLNKDGRLKSQLTADAFVSPTSMAIDESNNRAFILDKNKLYQINLK